MIGEAVRSIISFLRLPPVCLAIVALGCFVLLFAPPSWLARLGFGEQVEPYRPYVGLALVISSAGLSVLAAQALWNWFGERIGRRKAIRLLHSRLQALTEGEKQILRYYLQEETRTNILRIEDGVVQGLAQAEIIYLASTISDCGTEFAYNISDPAWEYLQKNPDLVNGATKDVRCDRTNRGW